MISCGKLSRQSQGGRSSWAGTQQQTWEDRREKASRSKAELTGGSGLGSGDSKVCTRPPGRVSRIWKSGDLVSRSCPTSPHWPCCNSLWEANKTHWYYKLHLLRLSSALQHFTKMIPSNSINYHTSRVFWWWKTKYLLIQWWGVTSQLLIRTTSITKRKLHSIFAFKIWEYETL